MRVVVRSGTKASVRVLAGHDKCDGVISWQRLGMAEQVQGRQAPIDAIQTKMLRQPVFEFVFSLSAYECRVVQIRRRDTVTDRVQAFDIVDVIINEELEFIRDLTAPGLASARTRHKRHDGNEGTRRARGGGVLVLLIGDRMITNYGEDASGTPEW